MKKIPKIRSVLQGNCCETCRNIPQKTPMNGEFTKKKEEFFDKTDAFSKRLQ